MEANGDPNVPASMTFMGGPIDTRRSPTEVNKLAEKRGVEWFRRNVLHPVPFPYPGFGRQVYPGFLQLSGFMAMNLDRHVNAHMEMFNHLVEGDGDSAEKHRDFYDEYLAVMDMDAAFYMQTIEKVFVQHALPKGELMHRGQLVDCTAIRRCALMTIEGEKDDIAGIGQTPGRARPLRQHSGRRRRPITCNWTSGITASSTAPVSATRSFPACANFWAAVDGKPAKSSRLPRSRRSKTGKRSQEATAPAKRTPKLPWRKSPASVGFPSPGRAFARRPRR